jgi:hypothetical protein
MRNFWVIGRELPQPYRALLVAITLFDSDVDIDKIRFIRDYPEPFRSQCLALILGMREVNLNALVKLYPLSEPFRSQALLAISGNPSIDVETLIALRSLPAPTRERGLTLATIHPKLEVAPNRLLQFTHYRPELPGHADIFFRDLMNVLEPAQNHDIHLTAALEWLLHSQKTTQTSGFSAAYSFSHGWLPPYPETTGYIISTLWDAYKELGDKRLQVAALAAADWEIEIQMESGATQAGYLGNDPQGFWGGQIVPAAFNTGQVVMGWNQSYAETGESRFLEASIRACRFLIECVDDKGIFRKGLSPGPTNPTRAYYTRVAFAMAWTGRLAGERAFEAAACRHLDWVISQQSEDGWFRFAGFHDDENPLTHTMAYTAEGMLYAGELLANEHYVNSSLEHVMSAAGACERRGMMLPAHFRTHWRSDEKFSCVPGNAQFAALWLKHGLRIRDVPLVNTGLKMVEWLKGLQSLDNPEPGIRGGLPGAWPVDGGYSIYSYVNWSAKYFIDALLLAKRAQRERFIDRE